MKVLVHTCCGPCLIYPHQVLKEKGFEITSFFYNPNIHSYTEYKKRLTSLKYLTEKKNITLYISKDYDIESFFRAVNNKEEEPLRCTACWRLRLNKTAQFAKENNFEYFTTTLSVSPYQDLKLIKEVGEEAAERYKVKFYFEDFRSGFKEAHIKAKELGLYLQKYCGCLYSERARYLKEYRRKR